MSSDQQDREPIPWKWLGMGLLLTVVGCIAAVLFLRAFLFQTQPPPAEPPQATIIILTAPPSPTMDLASSTLPPTPIPTFTPIPTPDAAIAPPEITSEFYAKVANTGGVGVTVRGGPSIRNVSRLVAEEGTIMLILDGPEEGDGFAWWQVQLQDGTEGWVVADFLEPAAAP
jgi:hypothetical protein